MKDLLLSNNVLSYTQAYSCVQLNSFLMFSIDQLKDATFDNACSSQRNILMG